MIIMKRILLFLLCIVISLGAFGSCGKDNAQGSDDTEEITESIETKEAAESTEPDISDGEDEIAASLMGVRQSMIGTPSMIALAYLGTTDSIENADVMQWLKDFLPQFTKDLPFITEIGSEHIIGESFGDLYLVVPCDENASVAVNRIDESNEVTEVLYRSDYGDPILVFANNTGYSPNTQINIVDNEGQGTTYYPMLNDLHYLSQPSDLSVLDISPYSEELSREYNDFLNYSWKLPEMLDLIDTSWDATNMLSDGTASSYHINFSSDGMYIQWDDGNLNAEWGLVTENGVCMLKLNPSTDEERSFCLLLSGEHDYIYLSQDFVNGAARCDELISIMMERTYG